MKNLLDDMVISASGWRKIFASDGNGDSMCKEISQSDCVLCAGIAHQFATWAKGRGCRTVCLGRDARPTGEAICKIINSVLVDMGLCVEYLSVCAAPEIMSYVKMTPELDCFLYVSASHNPAGHNGVKFGLGDGSVLGGDSAKEIISRFKAFMGNPDSYPKLEQLLKKVHPLEASAAAKRNALDTYLKFNLDTAFESKSDLETFIKAPKPSVVADMNGSARTLSIDRSFFDVLGIKYSFINDRAGAIAHGILPEGKNLSDAAAHLEELHAKDRSFTIGYVPDNDGDRGNLVLIGRDGRAMIPDAQTVFAMVCKAELSQMSGSNIAVAVNCPTSMRIECIAKKYGAKVFRSEVGEANVVALAAKLRGEGYKVRFMGEGSNGGNITFPATVRDPLNTIISLLKYAAKSLKSWDEMIADLPQFQTTATDDAVAKMQIRCSDHGRLKNAYEKIFAQQWDAKKSELERKFGITGWREVNYIGTQAYEGTGDKARKAGVKGGLKIIFSDKAGRDRAFIWMRGSGTEPVFRILADVESPDKDDECYLVGWQHQMVEEADRIASED